MNYKMTAHYARGQEQFIAEFACLDEAKQFIHQKVLLDELERKRIVYRLYEDAELLGEFNKENIVTTQARYAEGNADFSNSSPFLFSVFSQKEGVLDKVVRAQFNNKKDASLFVNVVNDEENACKTDDLFFIFKNGILIDTFNAAIMAHRKTASEVKRTSSSGSQFNPTPLSRRPTPSGGPSDCWVDSEPDKEQ